MSVYETPRHLPLMQLGLLVYLLCKFPFAWGFLCFISKACWQEHWMCYYTATSIPEITVGDCDYMDSGICYIYHLIGWRKLALVPAVGGSFPIISLFHQKPGSDPGFWHSEFPGNTGFHRDVVPCISRVDTVSTETVSTWESTSLANDLIGQLLEDQSAAEE